MELYQKYRNYALNHKQTPPATVIYFSEIFVHIFGGGGGGGVVHNLLT